MGRRACEKGVKSHICWLARFIVAKKSGVELLFFTKTIVVRRDGQGLDMAGYDMWRSLGLWVLIGEIKLGRRFSPMCSNW